MSELVQSALTVAAKQSAGKWFRSAAKRIRTRAGSPGTIPLIATQAAGAVLSHSSRTVIAPASVLPAPARSPQPSEDPNQLPSAMAPTLSSLLGGFNGHSAVSTALSTMFQPRREQQQNAAQSGSSALPAKVVAASAAEGGIKMYSNEYYWTCAAGGVVSCGGTHMAVTPLDVVKCNMQTNPGKYPNIGAGFSTIVKEQGIAGLFKGWVPTLLGYSAQGACKFGLYELFKKCATCSFC